MAILSKGCKPDNFESHSSLKLSCTNSGGLPSNFVECESFLESNSPDILALCEADLNDSIDSSNFSVTSFNPKGFCYPYVCSFSLCERRTSFCMGLLHGTSTKLCGFLLMFSTDFTSLSFLVHFNVHHKDWLTYSGGTDRLINSVIIFLSQMTLLRWLTFLLRSLTVTLTVLLIWICFFILMLVFVLQWLSLHWKVLIMLLSQPQLTFEQTQNKPRFIA